MLGLAIWLGGFAAWPATAFVLRPQERIVFLGDSVTAAGHFTVYVEAALRTRFPGQIYQVINSGLGSETVSGLTEDDHPGKRPDVNNRFPAEVVAFQPTVVVACYGMNDGIYHPYLDDYFALFQLGIERLKRRVEQETRARFMIMTPPPFDPLQVPGEDNRPWGDYGYKKPFAYYDQVLQVYSNWLIAEYDSRCPVADVHSRMNRHLNARRQSDSSFRMQMDAIHPDPTGHMIMALTLLERWQFPGILDAVAINAEMKSTRNPTVSDLKVETNALTFTWKVRLPVPVDSRWDPVSRQWERFDERLNSQFLQVLRLRQREYRLEIEGQEIARLNPSQLARGINVAGFEKYPLLEKSRGVLSLIWQQRGLGKDLWRAKPRPDNPRWLELEKQILTLCEPVELKVKLTPVPEKNEK